MIIKTLLTSNTFVFQNHQNDVLMLMFLNQNNISQNNNKMIHDLCIFLYDIGHSAKAN